ncbi:GNAT family N-acetyltransferase [Paenibacillus crassostreae]|uniref:GNAT family acetyltransferase n=1 Tax=Paenibacillus crassostreae TaxID=1763538 RepID=A0A167FTM1_9BACL|nr:GNAT family N-acetyltransferase [Paenibacillus crassostreae]AOZ94076.1 GNAT family N-acetyltransferase [Paenibacillus crassostreae]OAB76888.1 GNAT family acetyltransferase [Paenibacillus crassostreae]
MINLRDIIRLEFTYLETFTNRIATSWGSIFCNEIHPNYYDANHAHISDLCDFPKLVVDEVVDFYRTRNIIPRFYIYNLENQQNLISELKSRDFRYEELISPVQLWDEVIIENVNHNRITIEKVTEENYQEALEIESRIKEFGGMESIQTVYEEQFIHSSFTHYLLRYDGLACSSACIFVDGNQARMESVATIEEFRGMGLIGAMIQFIQKEVLHRGIKNLWVFPINESVEKVYRKYGFQTVDTMIMGHAFLGGKSIKEIREEEEGDCNE